MLSLMTLGTFLIVNKLITTYTTTRMNRKLIFLWVHPFDRKLLIVHFLLIILRFLIKFLYNRSWPRASVAVTINSEMKVKAVVFRAAEATLYFRLKSFEVVCTDNFLFYFHTSNKLHFKRKFPDN